MGSGPYATLSATNKEFVIDHLCERYFSLCGNEGGSNNNGEKARYELAAHCQRHNPALYADLVVTGLLQQRGGDLTAQDEWLSATPVYRDEAFWRMVAEDEDDVDDDTNENVPEVPFLMTDHNGSGDDGLLRKPSSPSPHHRVQALWFRWPTVNGKLPHRDSPWIPFALSEQAVLEERYQQIVREGGGRSGVRRRMRDSGVEEKEDADQEGPAAAAAASLVGGGDDDGGSGDDLISVPIGAPPAPACCC